MAGVTIVMGAALNAALSPPGVGWPAVQLAAIVAVGRGGNSVEQRAETIGRFGPGTIVVISHLIDAIVRHVGGRAGSGTPGRSNSTVSPPLLSVPE